MRTGRVTVITGAAGGTGSALVQRFLDNDDTVIATGTAKALDMPLALELGFQVQVVADAGGSMSKAADDIALDRMREAGSGTTSTNMILTELARNWASPSGEKLIPIVGELIPRS